MATSGSVDFTLTAAEIAQHALKELGVVEAGGTVNANDQSDAIVQLNLMIKLDQARGVKLWRYREAKLFVVPSQASYDLPGANVCPISELSETTLDADEASGQTVLSVTSTSNGAGFANSDTIGIVLDNDTIQWTTISSFVADDTVTVAAALTSAASSGNKVFAYTNTINRPLRITSIRRENSSQEVPMNMLSRQEYFDLPNKDNDGTPIEWFYDPQTTTGVLYLWSRPNTVDDEINFTYLESLEDIDTAASDNADYPQEWLAYLVFNLAVWIAPQHGISVSQETLLKAQAAREALMDWDQEEASIQFV